MGIMTGDHAADPHGAHHQTGIHGGPATRVVAFAVIFGFVFGSAVLIGELIAG